MSKKRNITCRKCKEKFTRLEYMQNTNCDRPDCTCPAITQARRMAAKVINDAMDSSRNHVQVDWKKIPDNKQSGVNQVYVEVPDVMTILVTPVKR